jgi:hypothetical protein
MLIGGNLVASTGAGKPADSSGDPRKDGELTAEGLECFHSGLDCFRSTASMAQRELSARRR